MMKPINKNSIVSFRYILLSAFRLECPIIADMSLMLWKRSCAFEPALTTHNFFSKRLFVKGARDADRNLGRTHRLPKQSATAWVSVIGDSGSCGLGMAATIGTLFGAFDVAHYRAKVRPDSVRIVHP
jgi:hypothetical protein